MKYGRRICLVAFVLLLNIITFAQKGMTFQQAKENGIFNELDSLYVGGVDSDSSKSVFKNLEEYTKTYQEFIFQFAGFLSENNFKWGKQVRCFNKIYFSKEGKVDYFLYNFKEGQLTPEQELEFGKLLQQFIQNAIFGMKADKPFSQCSPVTYTD